MTATAEFNAGTRTLTVDADGLPSPVAYGTFPNVNNPNSVTEQAFDHDFYYRGGTFGVTRQLDSNVYVHEGFFISVALSVADNSLLGNQIQVGDRVLFLFDEGTAEEEKLVFTYRGTEQTAIPGEFWRETDQNLQLVMEYTATGRTGTYSYYDQRNGRVNTPLGAIGIAANGVVFFNPSAGASGNPPVNFSWNAHFPSSPVTFGEDECGGHPEVTGQYHYHDTEFLECWKNGASMASYNDYYGSSQYNGDNLRHPDGHSKILGYAFDGFPIYGPYLYSNRWNVNSNITTATSSYRVRSEEVENRPIYGDSQQNPPAGSLMEDWEYAEGLGNLDRHNGRFCITPEFQSGTYAYFLSTEIDSENNLQPVFPYIMGLTSREVLDQPPNNGAATPPAPPSGGDTEAPPSVIQIALQPANATYNVNQTVTFSITAAISPEDGPKAYQWFRSTDGGFSFAVLTGATDAAYTFTALNYMSGYKFRCEVRGPLGLGVTPAQNSPLTSDVATLTVTGFGDGQGDSDFSSTDTKFDTTSISFDAT
jgi:hypothetical protein